MKSLVGTDHEIKPQIVVLLILLLFIITASCEERQFGKNDIKVVVDPTRKFMKVVSATRSAKLPAGESEADTGGLGTKLYPTGSNLPDCSHACGPCMPCKRVVVSFKCSIESCPVIYRCVCKGKYYHVPSP